MRLWNSIDPYKPGSENLRVGKAVAMGLVVTGHFYRWWWWVPVLFGLWIFAFSSGLFAKCDAMFLPVYVTHGYLYLGKHADDAWMRHLGFAFSVLLIYLISSCLSQVNEKLRPT